MKGVGRFTFLIFIVAATVGAFWLWRFLNESPGTGGGGGGNPQTRLEVEIHGGFAYVPTRTENRIEIAYLNDLQVPPDTTHPGAVGCNVNQLGTRLVVLDGNITQVTGGPVPADKTFDLDRAVVTFPALETSTGILDAPRGARPNGPNPMPKDGASWHDLKWVASVKEELPSNPLNPNWRNLPVVNGRLVLKGGRLRGEVPSDVIAGGGFFEFKRGATAVFNHAMTDKTRYDATVPGNEIVIQFTGATSGVTQFVVSPRNPGLPVVLKLLGLHTNVTVPELPENTPIKDYCSFYQLLSPVPPESQWLIPHYAGTQLGPDPVGAPSPGMYCPGHWGPEF